MNDSELVTQVRGIMANKKNPSLIWTMDGHEKCASVIRALVERLKDTSNLRVVCSSCESAKRARKRQGGQLITPGSGTEQSFMRFDREITTGPSWSVYVCPVCGYTVEIQRPYIRGLGGL